MTRSIAIGGFMGVGKTTVGRLLAARLGCGFIDLDQEVERRCGMTVVDIFAERGEAGFRAVEAECLETVLAGPNVVVALGGGTLHFGTNCNEIRKTADLICLGLPIEEIRGRIGQVDKTRPLWPDAERRYEERSPLYRTAGLYIDITGKTVNEVVDHLCEVVQCA